MKLSELKQYIKKNFNRQRTGKHFLLMLFETEITLGLSNNPNRWECVAVKYYDNGTRALDAYANIPNPASQLIDGRTEEELLRNAEKMMESMKNETWLNQNLYPYL